jgi:hypothetical protein
LPVMFKVCGNNDLLLWNTLPIHTSTAGRLVCWNFKHRRLA